MEQLFFAGKAYLKINSLVKTLLHEFMAVERSGLWAPWAPDKLQKTKVSEKKNKPLLSDQAAMRSFLIIRRVIF